MKLSYGSLIIQVGIGFYAYEEDECLNILPFERNAAITISCAKRTNGDEVPEVDLKKFVEKENLDEIVIERAKTAGAKGFKVSGFDDVGTYWLKWFLRNGPVIVFVTYNTDERLNSEEVEVSTMIDTIQISV